MDSIWEFVFAAVLMASLLSNFFGVPGNLLIAVNSFIYGLATSYEDFSFVFVLSLFAIFVFIEFLEYLLIVVSARKYGASKWGITGSIIGGIGGAISGAFVTPIIGAIIGSIIGVFTGATILEFVKSYDIKKAVMSGVGAFIGKLGGLSIKTCGAVTMVIMIGYKIF
ncbi:MAG: DUF456 domain-containing protein [Calditrichales bacterium]|nr:MAG: DUF456 domain-containing protein [Calditrichales bacterium]